MPEGARGVLITRPEPGASETAARVAALGFSPIVAPLMMVRALTPAWPPAARLQAVLVTSGNALPALPVTLHGVPLFAVGDATAARARASGFVRVRSADGDAGDLAGLAAAACRPERSPLLLVSGRGQGGALAATLRGLGFRVVRRVAYAVEPATALPPTPTRALQQGEVAAALFFSAETARAGVRLLARARLHEAVRRVEALAIGASTAVALEALPWRRIRVAARPNQDAMLALLQ